MDANPDVGARQVLLLRRCLLGRQEHGVAGIPDRLGHGPDGGVRHVVRIKGWGTHVLAVQDIPRLADQPEVAGIGGAEQPDAVGANAGGEDHE